MRLTESLVCEYIAYITQVNVQNKQQKKGLDALKTNKIPIQKKKKERRDNSRGKTLKYTKKKKDPKKNALQ